SSTSGRTSGASSSRRSASCRPPTVLVERGHEPPPHSRARTTTDLACGFTFVSPVRQTRSKGRELHRVQRVERDSVREQGAGEAVLKGEGIDAAACPGLTWTYHDDGRGPRPKRSTGYGARSPRTDRRAGSWGNPRRPRESALRNSRPEEGVDIERAAQVS